MSAARQGARNATKSDALAAYNLSTLEPLSRTDLSLSFLAGERSLMSVASPKRSAAEGACPATDAAKKRARYNFSKIDDYEMVEEIGKGTYGVVARARHRRTGEVVTVMWIRSRGCGGPSIVDADVRERGCLAACRGHPSIVQIKDIASNEDTGDLRLVMELVEGPCLRDWLTGPVSEDVAREFMGLLLSAAAKMHAAPLIHRHISPENILVSAGGELKICGFGCATPAKPLGKPYPEQRVGTLRYCSPEQLIGISSYGTPVDIWALGCVMAELVIGVSLFAATTEDDMITQIVDLRDEIVTMGPEAFDDMQELSPAGRELLASLLSFDPEDRPTATEALNHRWFTEEAAKPQPLQKAEFPGFAPFFSVP